LRGVDGGQNDRIHRWQYHIGHIALPHLASLATPARVFSSKDETSMAQTATAGSVANA
jgi:hypothetical protein